MNSEVVPMCYMFIQCIFCSGGSAWADSWTAKPDNKEATNDRESQPGKLQISRFLL